MKELMRDPAVIAQAFSNIDDPMISLAMSATQQPARPAPSVQDMRISDGRRATQVAHLKSELQGLREFLKASPPISIYGLNADLMEMFNARTERCSEMEAELTRLESLEGDELYHEFPPVWI